MENMQHKVSTHSLEIISCLYFLVELVFFLVEIQDSKSAAAVVNVGEDDDDDDDDEDDDDCGNSMAVGWCRE